MLSYELYEELKDNYLRNKTKENLIKLAKWFKMYGAEYWNGECYDVSDVFDEKSGAWGLYPIYKKVDEDEFEIIDWEIR